MSTRGSSRVYKCISLHSTVLVSIKFDNIHTEYVQKEIVKHKQLTHYECWQNCVNNLQVKLSRNQHKMLFNFPSNVTMLPFKLDNTVFERRLCLKLAIKL